MSLCLVSITKTIVEVVYNRKAFNSTVLEVRLHGAGTRQALVRALPSEIIMVGTRVRSHRAKGQRERLGKGQAKDSEYWPGSYSITLF